MATGLLVSLILAMLFGFLLHKFVRYCDQFRLADWGGKFSNRLAALISCFVHRYHGLSMKPIPLPDSGAAIVVCNHISGLDPLVLIAATPRPLRFLIAREEYERFGLQWLFRLGHCIPVERDKRPELAMRAALRAIDNGDVVALFPHGKIHLPADMPVRIKGGAVRLSQLTGAPVYPVHVEGIKGEGHTLLAIPLKSQIKLSTHPPHIFTSGSNDENIRKLQQLIETSTHINNENS
jgi:1-acyl-sn-glycerol-3-phosphate acyltransferase